MNFRGLLPNLPFPRAAMLAARTASCYVVLAAFLIWSPPLAHADDATAIRSLINATFGTPEARVEIDPVVVDGPHAIASWTQAKRGGRALLRRDGRGWRIVLCSGDPLKSSPGMISAGVPADVAARLAGELERTEAAVAADRRALFSTFEGSMVMHDHGHVQHKDHSR